MSRLDRILIVDDEAAHRLLTRRAISQYYPKIDIIEADCTNKAISIVSDNSPPALIFLDLNLKQERGITLLRYIRKQKWGKKIPVIILSTSALDEDIKESYDNEANAFMVKNSSLKDYQEEIKNAVSFFIRAYST